MADFGKRKLTDDDIEQLRLTTEILTDKYGNNYQISEEYRQEQIERRQSGDRIKDKLAHSIIQDGFKMLSKQERKVMKLIVKGITEQQIADLLGIKQQSVHTYKKRAAKKLKKYIPEFKEE